MVTIQDENSTFMYSENIPYTRIDMAGLVHTEAFIEQLSSPKLFALLTEKGVKSVLLNLSQCWRVGTEDMEWIEATWLSRLSGVGVRKVSVVTVAQVQQMLTEYFHDIEESAGKIGMEVHFFNDDQFYNGWEAVGWF